MKITLNLTPTTVKVADKYCPAIDDGETVSYFDAHLYGGEANALEHARNTIEGLRRQLRMATENWHMNVKK